MAKRFKHRLAEDDVQALQQHERQNLQTLTGNTNTPELRAIPLDHISLDGGTQPRVGLDEDTVAEYTERMQWDDLEGAIVDPDLRRWEAVTLFFDGTKHWLADGFHRVAAARRNNITSIQANVHQGSLRDAVAHSLGANATHGKRRTNDDKRRAVQKALEDQGWSAFSDRELARMCKVSQPFVSKVRSHLETKGALAPSPTRINAKGERVEVGVVRKNRAVAKSTPASPALKTHTLDARDKGAKQLVKNAQNALKEHDVLIVLFLSHSPWQKIADVEFAAQRTSTSHLCFLKHEDAFALVWQQKAHARKLKSLYPSLEALEKAASH